MDDKAQFKADIMRLGAQAALMRELIHSDMWACYAEQVSDMLSGEVERMLQSVASEFGEHKGRILGLRQALTLPQQIIQRAEAMARN